MAKLVSVLSLLLIPALFAGWAAHHSDKTQSTPPKSSSPVVVELFTSEGCSSCPPADQLLGELDRDKSIDGVPVIALSEHVDYWDGQGWKDRFSSRAFTDRQNGYAHELKIDSAYTPQMVVDGRTEFVGSDRGALLHAVHSAAGSAQTANVALRWTSPTELNVTVSNAKTDATVLLAITESGLTTKVDAGENGGRVLRHAAVVRSLRELGVIKDGRFSSAASINVDPTWNKAQLKAVVMAQDGPNGPLIGAAAVPFQQ